MHWATWAKHSPKIIPAAAPTARFARGRVQGVPAAATVTVCWCVGAVVAVLAC